MFIYLIEYADSGRKVKIEIEEKASCLDEAICRFSDVGIYIEKEDCFMEVFDEDFQEYVLLNSSELPDKGKLKLIPKNK